MDWGGGEAPSLDPRTAVKDSSMCWDRSGAIYRYEYAFLHQWSWKLNCMSHFTRAICWSFDIYSAWLWVFPLMGRLCCDFTQGFYAWELMPRWVKPLWACWIAMSLHGWSSFFFSSSPLMQRLIIPIHAAYRPTFVSTSPLLRLLHAVAAHWPQLRTLSDLRPRPLRSSPAVADNFWIP